MIDRIGFKITDGLATATNAAGVSGIFYLYAPHSAKYTYGRTIVTQMTSATYVSSLSEQSAHIVNEDTDALQFKFDSGSIASGEITMFGIKNA